ncbi:MAG: WXG100 family type VII secretion target [Anaerolineae bacterium]|jgi:WXG100 family type VII secretion target|nr:WXG100 family type VII secretion target [Anaerolineae bacterium]
MADKIEVNYEQLEQISQMLSALNDNFTGYTQKFVSMADNLTSQGWIGMGSDAFEAETKNEFIPRLKRLTAAFEQASSSIKQIVETMGNAEEEAGNRFR